MGKEVPSGHLSLSPHQTRLRINKQQIHRRDCCPFLARHHTDLSIFKSPWVLLLISEGAWKCKKNFNKNRTFTESWPVHPARGTFCPVLFKKKMEDMQAAERSQILLDTNNDCLHFTRTKVFSSGNIWTLILLDNLLTLLCITSSCKCANSHNLENPIMSGC